MRLLRFTARTHRLTIIAGTALVVLLAGVTGNAYQSSYPSSQARPTPRADRSDICAARLPSAALAGGRIGKALTGW